MDKLVKDINERMAILKKAARRAEREAGTFPEGHLRVSVDKGYPRYYCVTEIGDVSGKYIAKNNRMLAYNLAQKDYNEAFIKQAKEELNRLQIIKELLSKEDADYAYTGISEHRRKLIRPYILTDALYAEAWLRQPFKTNPYKPEEKTCDTNRGDKVRTKSEGFLANMFYDLGIPYRYEEGIRMSSGNMRYPDFTLLKVKTKEEFYFEHLGRLDLSSYRADNFIKMDEYRASGIYLGKNLLVSYEVGESPLDLRGIRKMLIEIFEP